jgi:hypothetical protein
MRVKRSLDSHNILLLQRAAAAFVPGRRSHLAGIVRLQALMPMSLIEPAGRIHECSSDALCPSGASLAEVIEAVRALPYGRPSDRTVAGMLREGRGTCSTKHLFLARLLAERFPETEPLIVHRVYLLDRVRARELFGPDIAEVVPATGLVDVHRYLTITLDRERIIIDATFPGAPWDGRSSLRLACGPGSDHPTDGDPDAEKRELEGQHCDPTVRESFIIALAGTAAP